MKRFADLLAVDPNFRAALPAPGHRSAVGSVLGASSALALAAAQRASGLPILAVIADPDDAERLVSDLELFGARARLFPPRGEQPDRLRLRLEAAAAARAGEREIFVAPLLALLEPLPDAASVHASILAVAVGAEIPPVELLRRLIAAGFERVPLVARPGELSLRGDLLDVWPFAADAPLRIEAFEDRIESIRRFDASTQRSIERLERIAVPLVRDAEVGGADPIASFAAQTLVARIEPTHVEERGEGLAIQGESLRARWRRLRDDFEARPRLDLRSLPGGDFDLGARSARELGVGLRPSADVVTELAREREVFVFCANEAESHRLGEILTARGVDASAPIHRRVGELSRGFVLPRLGFVALSHAELVGAIAVRRIARVKKSLPTRAIEAAHDLKPGDHVVHAVHGVGLFLGVERIRKGPGEEDHLVIEFAEETKLFVPAARIDLVAKYVGAGRAAPPLDRIGGTSFARRKAQVRRAVADLAAELLEVQAHREIRVGFACPSEDALDREFEAAFPFTDTDDQARVTVELKSDLESPRPMDRLLCGDVGYGKTELALRTAFKVVHSGRQVAVLVPTTVLAQQHLQTFRERFAEFPVTVDAVSRFRTDKEIRGVLRRAKEGSLDVLIGTHRLLSNDVAFRDLGLVVIDEEQRFGVRAKERLKRLRASVDVLSMTATPIPRTLHLALVGLRDISSLATPPPGREAVETHMAVCEDDELIQRALRFELNRGGQVYFIHNRIASLERRAEQLAQLVPEARYAIAHGQMGGEALEETMTGFVQREFEVLVTTAIVESGLDIPTANTIFLDHAEWFGLADLHQLRGRVGRGNQKGYCYLLTPQTGGIGADAKARLRAIEELQQLGAGFDIAMRDLEIRGAGNLLGSEQSGHIAAVGYDLYCRLLKATVERMTRERKRRLARETQVAAQLGIPAPAPVERVTVKQLSDEEAPPDANVHDGEETTVLPPVTPASFERETSAPSGPPLRVEVPEEDLGCDLELGVRAFLPDAYVPDARLRLEAYRALDGARDRKSRDAIAADLRDRFGRMPVEVERLLDLFVVKNRLRGTRARRIVFMRDRYVVDHEDRERFEATFRAGFADRRHVEEGHAHLVFPRGKELVPDAAFALLLRALEPVAPPVASKRTQRELR